MANFATGNFRLDQFNLFNSYSAHFKGVAFGYSDKPGLTRMFYTVKGWNTVNSVETYMTLGGDDFHFNWAGEILGGTVEQVDGSSFSAFGFSISALKFYDAALTPTVTDDISLLSEILSGSDKIYLGQMNDRMRGFSGADTIWGNEGRDVIFGDFGSDTLLGGAGNDNLSGDDGADRLLGGAGKDILSGGEGHDRFVFNSLEDSRPGDRSDVVVDFAPGDKLDLSRIDALSGVKGNQNFHFIGSDTFELGKGGELRFSAGTLQGDVNGDGKSDFELDITGNHRVGLIDLVL